MTTHAKTIQIFLPDGNPRGVKIADALHWRGRKLRQAAEAAQPEKGLVGLCARLHLHDSGVHQGACQILGMV